MAVFMLFPDSMHGVKKKLLNLNFIAPFLWMGFNCFKATQPLQGGSLLFTTKFPESPGTHLIYIGRMKG